MVSRGSINNRNTAERIRRLVRLRMGIKVRIWLGRTNTILPGEKPTGTLVADSGDYEGLPGLWAYSIPRAIAYVFLILNLVIMAIWTVLYPILMKKNAD